ALAQAGQPVPVEVGGGATVVMIEGALGRDRLLLDGRRFVSRRSGESWSFEQLAALADDDPERLSPNVLARPVVEAALLPTVAYVAGPGELGYLPQSQPLYERLRVAPQVPVPRWAGRVIERRVQKVLDKYEITPEDLGAPEGQLEASLVRGDMPRDATQAMTRLRETVDAEYQRLQEIAETIDPTLRRPVQAAMQAALSGISDVEKRLITHLKKRNDIVVQQLAKARHSVFPLGKPQERVLNIVGYLIRYGPNFLDVVRQSVEGSMPSLDPSSAES
ncbi:MAG: bacillithiol biosynthesis BshC, partial [Gemmatimonadales bacterium]